MTDLSWEVDEKDPMVINIINRWSKENLMSLFVGEALEVAGRKRVMEFVKECNNSPWLPHWNRND